MSLAQRFTAALAAETAGSEDDDGHLLPERLARVVTRVLPVDGAGLSVQLSRLGRCPLGASPAAAGRAERLQFTVGNGPCLLSVTTGHPVFLVAEDLQRRWPVLAELLLEQTPYRGVVSLPVRHALAGTGALDLYLTDPAGVASLDVFDAVAVGDLVAAALTDAAVWSTWSEAEGPHWLHSPPAERRAAVWQAVGLTSAALDLDAAEALAVLRAHAYGAGRTVDSVAADLVSGRLVPADVVGRPGAG
ncbi:GAF domain-containing protein [uncultured Modestobacter sp.]|uniref:GAF domain-containing protein n=1 Tax=uncultured Modestobacter sp. TaxID=380048 RepID=UPI002615E553|nr:GAF domain-containing protein [uncultured Modestobacter sp.]